MCCQHSKMYRLLSRGHLRSQNATEAFQLLALCFYFLFVMLVKYIKAIGFVKGYNNMEQQQRSK